MVTSARQQKAAGAGVAKFRKRKLRNSGDLARRFPVILLGSAQDSSNNPQNGHADEGYRDRRMGPKRDTANGRKYASAVYTGAHPLPASLGELVGFVVP